jgi:hypothetical protein
MRYIFYVVIKPRLWSDQLLHATPKHKDTVWQLAAGTTLWLDIWGDSASKICEPYKASWIILIHWRYRKSQSGLRILFGHMYWLNAPISLESTWFSVCLAIGMHT